MTHHDQSCFRPRLKNMDLIFVTLLIISAQLCTTLADSPCVCSRNLSPVCGSDGITYGNPCLLGCAATTARKQITLARSGSCEEALSGTVNSYCFCPAVYEPVCGSDGKTYGNLCGLSCEKSSGNPSLEIAHDGPCDTPSQRMASNDVEYRDCIIPAVYAPVCGSDGKTYGNKYELSCEKSYGNPSLEIAYDGPCDTPSEIVGSHSVDKILIADM